MSRFRANLQEARARGAWRIGPRTAMPMGVPPGVSLPGVWGDPTGGAGGRGRGAGRAQPAIASHAGRVLRVFVGPAATRPVGDPPRSLDERRADVGRARARGAREELRVAHDPRQGAPRGGGHRAQAGQRRCGDATEVGAGGVVARRGSSASASARWRRSSAGTTTAARHDARRASSSSRRRTRCTSPRLPGSRRCFGSTQRRVNSPERRRVLRRTYRALMTRRPPRTKPVFEPRVRRRSAAPRRAGVRGETRVRVGNAPRSDHRTRARRLAEARATNAVGAWSPRFGRAPRRRRHGQRGGRRRRARRVRRAPPPPPRRRWRRRRRTGTTSGTSSPWRLLPRRRWRRRRPSRTRSARACAQSSTRCGGRRGRRARRARARAARRRRRANGRTEEALRSAADAEAAATQRPLARAEARERAREELRRPPWRPRGVRAARRAAALPRRAKAPPPRRPASRRRR